MGEQHRDGTRDDAAAGAPTVVGPPDAVGTPDVALGEPGIRPLELSGVTPPTYEFTERGLLVLPHAIGLPEAPIMVLMGVSAVTHMIVPLVAVARMSDRSDEAEERLHTYAWHIGEILPQAVRRVAEPGAGAEAATPRSPAG